jgi:hypothetical protein
LVPRAQTSVYTVETSVYTAQTLVYTAQTSVYMVETLVYVAETSVYAAETLVYTVETSVCTAETLVYMVETLVYEAQTSGNPAVVFSQVQSSYLCRGWKPMTHRLWTHSGWCLAAALPVFLLAATAGWSAETRPLPVPARLRLRLEVKVLRLDDATQAMVPVRADSKFKTGDAVVFEVKASQGGYLALLSSSTVGPPWLWPQAPAGEPTPSQQTMRVPASGLIRLKDPSPTKLSLVFSPLPLDGSPPPGSPSGKPRWLKQIILREAKLEPGSAPAGPALIFEGDLNEAEKAVVELELRHP